jgi:hypothetical protein
MLKKWPRRILGRRSFSVQIISSGGCKSFSQNIYVPCVPGKMRASAIDREVLALIM